MPRPKPLSREMIVNAMKYTSSNRGAARFLGVSYNHYRSYASLYKDEESGKTLYEIHRNRGNKGQKKFALNQYKNRRRQEPAILDIVNGRVPSTSFNPKRIKDTLIRLGMLKCKCAQCGYKEKRLVDGKSPLILYHKNKNKNDWKLENLELICYNCAFLRGGADCPVTEEFVEKAEDAVERTGFYKENRENFELDEYQKEFLKNLGIHKEEEKPYEKYISRV